MRLPGSRISDLSMISKKKPLCMAHRSDLMLSAILADLCKNAVMGEIQAKE